MIAEGRADARLPSGGDRVPWTSTLSVAEFAALRQTGFEPVGMVFGASVYRFGQQVAARRLAYHPRYGSTGFRYVSMMAPHPQRATVHLRSSWSDSYQQTYPCKHVGSGHVPGINYDDEPFQRAVTEAYEIARDALRADVTQLGAHGVIGAAITLHHPPLLESSAPTSEIRLVGTAVRAVGAEPLDRPFVSHLSGQEFAKLIGAGLVPLDTAIGVGAVRSYFGCAGSRQDPFMRNEFTQRTDAIQRCREQAIRRLTSFEDGRKLMIVGTQLVGPFAAPHLTDTLFEHALAGTVVVRFGEATSAMPRVTIGLGTR